MGRHQQTTARPALIVTGPAAAGKTTALHPRRTHLPPRPHPPRPGAARAGPHTRDGRVCSRTARRDREGPAEFARYLGVPAGTRMTQAQITEAVCHTYDRAGVRLVLIDEIHRLNPRTSTGAETADLLKDLTERIGATFVYAGIDVVATPLFSGVRGAQLAGRASLIECGAFPARLGKREPFTELIAGVEAALDLNAHRAGTLPRLAAHLHQRTAGRIGSPLPPHPPSRDHHHRRRHRTHHQNQPRPDPPGPPRRNPAPPRHHHRVPHTRAMGDPGPATQAKAP
ncbi:TniB family NTP-binding protein [Embleya sp. NBC_00896]|uniref:TniB family NTP-binding protein n=1 Tax=Embleya sp. NBC_00896 TaxID=2975961 RepID=UPI002F91B171|nr:TniB family NTP-binding protein [Embleya sp. NBC_00896]